MNRKKVTSLIGRLSALAVSLALMSLVAEPVRADTMFVGVGCPGLGFVAGVTVTGPDVDITDICDFLSQGGGLSGPGFGIGGGGGEDNPAEACREAGGTWDAVRRRCIIHPLPDPNPNPRPCATCAPSPPTARLALPSRPTMFYGLPVTFKGNHILILVKPSYVTNGKTRVKMFPVVLSAKRDGSLKLKSG
jgi:hypothetical protein